MQHSLSYLDEKLLFCSIRYLFEIIFSTVLLVKYVMSSFKLFAGPQDFTQSFFFWGEKTNADATLFVYKNRQKSLIIWSLNVAETFGFTVRRKSLYDRLKNPLIELPIKLIKHSV